MPHPALSGWLCLWMTSDFKPQISRKHTMCLNLSQLRLRWMWRAMLMLNICVPKWKFHNRRFLYGEHQKINPTLDPGSTSFMLCFPLNPGTFRAFTRCLAFSNQVKASSGCGHPPFFLLKLGTACVDFLIERMRASICVGVCWCSVHVCGRLCLVVANSAQAGGWHGRCGVDSVFWHHFHVFWPLSWQGSHNDEKF